MDSENRRLLSTLKMRKMNSVLIYAVTVALHYKDIPYSPVRVCNIEPHVGNYKWNRLEFPVSLNKIDRFDKDNPDIAVNVLCEEEKKKKIYICRKSKFNDRSKVVNLLLITEREKRHYTAIKSLSKLLGSLNSKNEHKRHFCVNCLNSFNSVESRDKHYEYCVDREAVKIEMPKQGSKIRFTDGSKQMKVPFIMYADFESILAKFDSDLEETKDENGKKSYTRKVNQHIPSGFCVYSKFAHGEVEDPLKVYRGRDCVQIFCDYIEKEVKRLYNMFPEKEMDPLTKDEWSEYNRATRCHICMEYFEMEDKKVRDHCHFTGKFRGAAHMTCNLKYRIPKYIPIVFHNLSGYDAHLFIRELGKKFNTEDIKVIAENTEKYITFSVDVVVDKYKTKKGEIKDKKMELRFIDSMRFMSSSLDKLSSNLTDDQCKSLKQFYGDNFKLMRRKGSFPYEFLNSWERFDETQLPPKNEFYSNLNMGVITDEDYSHAQEVWKLITPEDDKTTTPGNYHDVYLATDVLLLTDVFESFRETCMEHYDLDPAHFYTAPGLAWQA